MTDREKGAKAIMLLQEMVGITMTMEEAAKAWDGFSDHEKQLTIEMHDHVLNRKLRSFGIE